MTMEQQIVIGKIAAPHGVRGEFRIMPLTDQPQRYAKMKIVHLDDGRDLTVVSVRQHKNVYLMMVKEITNMDEAEAAGPSACHFPQGTSSLPKGQFYVRDILGFAVESPDGEAFGTVKDVISPGSTDVFVIASPTGEEILLAAIKENILTIDWAEHKVVAKLPEWI